MNSIDSRAVALAMAIKIARYARRLERTAKISAAERRHLIRIRTVRAIRSGKTND